MKHAVTIQIVLIVASLSFVVYLALEPKEPTIQPSSVTINVGDGDNVTVTGRVARPPVDEPEDGGIEAIGDELTDEEELEPISREELERARERDTERAAEQSEREAASAEAFPETNYDSTIVNPVENETTIR